MLDRRGSTIGRRCALVCAPIACAVTLVRYSHFGWVRPADPKLTLVAAILLNLAYLAIMGIVFDRRVITLRSRLQATILGATICAPLVDIVQLTMNVQPLTATQLIGGIAVGGMMGAIVGLVGG